MSKSIYAAVVGMVLALGLVAACGPGGGEAVGTSVWAQHAEDDGWCVSCGPDWEPGPWSPGGGDGPSGPGWEPGSEGDPWPTPPARSETAESRTGERYCVDCEPENPPGGPGPTIPPSPVGAEPPGAMCGDFLCAPWEDPGGGPVGGGTGGGSWCTDWCGVFASCKDPDCKACTKCKPKP